MRHLSLLLLTTALMLTFHFPAVGQTGNPNVSKLKLVAQLPPELPQRVTGLAFDGEKLWTTIYLGRGRYVTLDPATLNWELPNDDAHYDVIKNVAGAFGSPGGLCFLNDELWIGSAYGESIGAINRQTWEVRRVFKGKQRTD